MILLFKTLWFTKYLEVNAQSFTKYMKDGSYFEKLCDITLCNIVLLI